MCRAGDVVMFRSEVWHRGTSNRSGEVRYLLQSTTHSDDYAEVPPYLNKFRFDPDIIERCTPRQRRY